MQYRKPFLSTSHFSGKYPIAGLPIAKLEANDEFMRENVFLVIVTFGAFCLHCVVCTLLQQQDDKKCVVLVPHQFRVRSFRRSGVDALKCP